MNRGLRGRYICLGFARVAAESRHSRCRDRNGRNDGNDIGLA